MTDEVLLEKRGACGHIVLNRPQALNALTLTMVRALDPVLRQWAVDPDISHVFIEGAGEKGFCAGGDIRALHDWGKAGAPEATGFYREEYVVNTLIKRFPKPYIALMDGVTMGGGVGVSVHGQYRLVTDRTVFAMPETGIGLLPDVGGTYFLPRLRGEIGTYMALTGARLKAADCLYAGIATHYVPLSDIDEVRDALLTGGNVEDVLSSYGRSDLPAPLESVQGEIDRLFNGNSVVEILAALEADGSDWARAQRDTILQKSPTSCGVALRQCREGADLEFEDCMRLEMRAVTRIMSEHDFYEGVRAVIIDKDQSPKWQPNRFGDVDSAMLDKIFADLGAKELVL